MKKTVKTAFFVLVFCVSLILLSVICFAYQVDHEVGYASTHIGDIRGDLYLYASPSSKQTSGEFDIARRDVPSYNLNTSDPNCKITLSYTYSYWSEYTTGILWWKEEHRDLITATGTETDLLSSYPETYTMFNTSTIILPSNYTLKSSQISIYAYLGDHDLSGFRYDMTCTGSYN